MQLVIALFFFVCAGFGSAPAQVQRLEERVELRLGSKIVRVEVARTESDMARGLMHRPTLGDNEGMLFLLGSEQRASFWMKNTLLPLTIAYLDKRGVILELHDLKPLDLTPKVSTSDRVMFALEMNQGWFRLNQIPVGTQVHVVGRTWEQLSASGLTPSQAKK